MCKLCKKKKPIAEEPATEEFIMRDFFYLNKDFLTSFAAQTGKGLESSREETKFNREEKGNPKFSIKPTIDVGTKKAIHANAKLEASLESASLTCTEENTSKTIYTKKIHDELFNEFKSSVKFRKKNDIEEGVYLEDRYELNFINFARITSLFDDKLWERYIELSGESGESKFPRENLKGIRNNLSFLREIIPYDTFLCGEDIFVPIDDSDLLRGKLNQIGFSFGKEVTVVGRVKKLMDFNPQNPEKLVNTLNEIQVVAFRLMHDLGFIKIPKIEKVYIINPIAIFF